MKESIHLYADDPLAWKAYADWLEDQGLPWRQPSITNFIGMEFSLIPTGRFMMGSPESEEGRFNDEGPQYEVEISQPFYLGIHSVTQAQWLTVMGNNPSYFSSTGGGKNSVKGMDTDDFPVEQVSWQDAQEFLNKLSDRAEERGKGWIYRLPTEAEWEYACRAGTTTPFYFGTSLSSTQANFNGRHPCGGAKRGHYLNRTCRVGSYLANAFGLFDMHGNVWEWCADWYGPYVLASEEEGPAEKQESFRSVRGGGWPLNAWGCRSANRNGHSPGIRFDHLGFRVVAKTRQSFWPP